MSTTAMVRARLEPDLKTHAEHIFNRLGLNATQAITMFYKQVELRDGLPSDVVVPTSVGVRSVWELRWFLRQEGHLLCLRNQQRAGPRTVHGAGCRRP